MPSVIVSANCYCIIGKILQQVKKEKEKEGRNPRTTFGEVVCVLVKESGRLKQMAEDDLS